MKNQFRNLTALLLALCIMLCFAACGGNNSNDTDASPVTAEEIFSALLNHVQYATDLSDNSDEVKATISTGVSINHVITIFIALFGGWIWETLGIETLFIASAVLGLCNSAYAATIKTPK